MKFKFTSGSTLTFPVESMIGAVGFGMWQGSFFAGLFMFVALAFAYEVADI